MENAANAMADPEMIKSATADLIVWLRQKEAAKRPAQTVGDYRPVERGPRPEYIVKTCQQENTPYRSVARGPRPPG